MTAKVTGNMHGRLEQHVFYLGFDGGSKKIDIGISKEVGGRPPRQTCPGQEFTKGIKENLIHDAWAPQPDQGCKTGSEKDVERS